MVTQSRAKAVPLLLTRPEAQGADFAKRLSIRFGNTVKIIKTPLLAPRFLSPALPAGPFSALILTSQTGVEGYLRLGAARHLPRQVYCVGERTASAARAAQLVPVSIADDAASLILQIKALQPEGTLLHLRGREVRGNIGALLLSAGIDTKEAEIYAQDPLALTAAAAETLLTPAPVLVPLFSPRTAAIFTAEMARLKGVSPLFVAAMSGQVALEAGALGAQVKVAIRPDVAAMIETIELLLTHLQHD